jgi:hypothetical protein
LIGKFHKGVVAFAIDKPHVDIVFCRKKSVLSPRMWLTKNFKVKQLSKLGNLCPYFEIQIVNLEYRPNKLRRLARTFGI